MSTRYDCLGIYILFHLFCLMFTVTEAGEAAGVLCAPWQQLCRLVVPAGRAVWYHYHNTAWLEGNTPITTVRDLLHLVLPIRTGPGQVSQHDNNSLVWGNYPPYYLLHTWQPFHSISPCMQLLVELVWGVMWDQPCWSQLAGGAKSLESDLIDYWCCVRGQQQC